MKLRNLAPWRRFEIDTSWAPEVAVSELKKSVDAGSLFFSGSGSAPFVGEILGNAEFLIKRRIQYRNSFLPIIRVVLEPSHHGGARLRVTMRLHYFVGVFMVVWMTLAMGPLVTVSRQCRSRSLVGPHRAGVSALRHRSCRDPLCRRSTQGGALAPRHLCERTGAAATARDGTGLPLKECCDGALLLPGPR